jgi:DNA-binding LacI/PurR family transcriptional regulator
MRALGREPRVLAYGEKVPRAERVARLLPMLRAPDRPTAIIAYEIDDILPVQIAALTLGMRVPEDLSLIGIHDTPIDLGGVAVTTMRIPTREMGSRAIELVRERIADPTRHLDPCALPFTRVDGVTCAPPAR